MLYQWSIECAGFIPGWCARTANILVGIYVDRWRRRTYKLRLDASVGALYSAPYRWSTDKLSTGPLYPMHDARMLSCDSPIM